MPVASARSENRQKKSTLAFTHKNADKESSVNYSHLRSKSGPYTQRPGCQAIQSKAVSRPLSWNPEVDPKIRTRG